MAFSISGWSLFDKSWSSIYGYHADEFQFIQGKTPLSTFKETAIIVLAYLVIIFGGQEFMRNRKPLQLNTLFKIHNLGLTIVSGVLLALFCEQLFPTLWQDGFYENICGVDGWTDRLVVLYYVSAATLF